MINGPVWDEMKLEGQAPTVLAIGDSWFWYLINNLANPLHRMLNRNRSHIILVRGHNGAEANEYVTGPVRKQIELDVDRRKGYARTLEAVFISGGGNDIAGREDMKSILLPDCSTATTPEECFRRGQPSRMLNGVLDALMNTVDLVTQNLPSKPVFIHSYDYAVPNGRGFLGLGQWLQYPMKEVGVKLSLQQGVVNVIMDTYAQKLIDATSSHQNLHFVDTRGTLVPEEWANELHPTPAGFNKLAKKWRPSLEQAGLL